MRAAEKLKKALWGQDLQGILKKTSNGLAYLPDDWICHLDIRRLGYSERGFLLRPEYETALKMDLFDRQKAMEQNHGGVIIMGQSGIGMYILVVMPFAQFADY
jgi:hypothetical protein